MREYVPKIPYIRGEVWKRSVSVIKDYEALKQEYDKAKVWEDTRYTNMLRHKIEAVEAALNELNNDERTLMSERFRKHKTYRDIALPMSVSTMKRYVRRFVIEVGRNLGEIEQ